ncbi:Asp-tRNA(Asn)/Glu-tRNA(Gln) amidotransferase subunit GatB [Chlamydiota bacterium]
MRYEPVIGLEVHVQLKTESKIFCGCKPIFGAVPNTNVCPVCLGLPGVLPVLNEKAIYYAVLVGLATGSEIAPFSKFDRKNYFYPDLPKAYQISQYDKPLCSNGSIEIAINGNKKKIRLTRIHLEEDAGKLVHAEEGNSSGIDYNRCGTPLIEIVTDPDLSSPPEAVEFLKNMKQLLEYLDVSDCTMQEGSLRCDANISLRLKGETQLGTKTEIKNMNSFSGIERALNYEISRQTDLLEKNIPIIQETRLWNQDAQKTRSMRSKEEAHDYRYFPEPDLVPVILDKKTITEWKKDLPELPLERKERFIREYGLSRYDGAVLTANKHTANFFEDCAKKCANYKALANWIMGDLARELNENNYSLRESGITHENLVNLILLIDSGKISTKIAKEVFLGMFYEKKDPETIVNEKGLLQISSEDDLTQIVDEVISQNQKSVSDYRSGKKNALSFLVGQVMRLTKGKANPQKVNDMLLKRLESK